MERLEPAWRPADMKVSSTFLLRKYFKIGEVSFISLCLPYNIEIVCAISFTTLYFLIQQEGTLKPYAGFDAEADAEKLRKAMKGLGTNEDAITSVLGARSATQRVDVA